jgi:hypothetical protein
MTMIKKILSIVAPVEAGNPGHCSTPANDNDPKGPPPAAAARLSHCAFGERVIRCSAMISRL